MQTIEDYAKLDDPQFLDERRHVREKLEGLPETHPGRADLLTLYDALNDEFDRRARLAWQHAS